MNDPLEKVADLVGVDVHGVLVFAEGHHGEVIGDLVLDGKLFEHFYLYF